MKLFAFINHFQNLKKYLMALYSSARSGNTETRAAAAYVSRNNNKAKRPRRRSSRQSRRAGHQSQRRVGSARHPHFGPPIRSFRTVVGPVLRSRSSDSARLFAKMTIYTTTTVQSTPMELSNRIVMTFGRRRTRTAPLR